MKKITLYIALIIFSNSFAQQVSSIDVIQHANDFLDYQWIVSSANISTGTYTSNYSCSDASNKYVVTPDWVNDTSSTNKSSIPYKWGGFSSLSGFQTGITNGKFAGDIQTRHPGNTSVHYSCGTSAAVGLDCSGFTSRCFELSSHISTYGMGHSSEFGTYASYNDIQPGDIANHPSSHVRLIVHVNANGTVNTIEAGAGNNLWQVFPANYSTSGLVNYGYDPQYYIHMTHDGESKPENDLCEDTTTLLSHASCQATAGNLVGATEDVNLSLGICDTYTGNDSGKGVFYKFLAIETTENITLTPQTTDIDPVLVLYSGNDCSNLTQIACANNAGAGTQEQIVYNNCTPGENYWVRVYNHGNAIVSQGNFNVCVTHTPTQAVYLQYSLAVLADGGMAGNGNQDNIINPGETISLALQLYNAGNSTAHNVSASISTTDADINIIQNTINFNDIDSNATSISMGLLFDVNNLCMQKDTYLQISMQSDEGTWTQNLPIHIITNDTADLRYAGNVIHDGLGGGIGNYNQIVNPGEEIDMNIKIKNIGKQTAQNVIVNLSTTDPDITITDNQVNMGDILSGETVTSNGDFDYSVTATCLDKDIEFNLLISSSEGNWDAPFIIHVSSSNNVAEINKDLFKIYPNPSHHYINISKLYHQNIQNISIYTMNGKKIFSSGQDTYRIDISNYKQGLYILEIISDDQHINRFKIIKN